MKVTLSALLKSHISMNLLARKFREKYKGRRLLVIAQPDFRTEYITWYSYDFLIIVKNVM